MMEVSLIRLGRTYDGWARSRRSIKGTNAGEIWNSEAAVNYLIKKHGIERTRADQWVRGYRLQYHILNVRPYPGMMVRLSDWQWKELLTIEAADEKNK